MNCGKRADKRSLDSLEKTTVEELLSIIRGDPIMKAVWKTEFQQVRRRDVLCKVLFWKKRQTPKNKSIFSYKGEPVDPKNIRQQYIRDPANLLYKQTVPFMMIIEDQYKILKMTNLPKRFLEDTKDFIVYNTNKDTFAMFTGDDDAGEYRMVEFNVLGPHQYTIVGATPLSYNASNTRQLRTPQGYVALSFK
jgi:hypothetical protein